MRKGRCTRKRDEKEKRLARRTTALSFAGVKYSILTSTRHFWHSPPPLTGSYTEAENKKAHFQAGFALAGLELRTTLSRLQAHRQKQRPDSKDSWTLAKLWDEGIEVVCVLPKMDKFSSVLGQLEGLHYPLFMYF